MKLNGDKEMLAGIIRLRGIVAQLLPQSFFLSFHVFYSLPSRQQPFIHLIITLL